MVFQTKWNQVDRVVAELKENSALMRSALGPDTHIRILTDLSGPFFTIVQEIEVASLAEWERIRTAMFANPEFQQMYSSMEENPFISGRAEYYTLEAVI
jgi:hypothetical protein